MAPVARAVEDILSIGEGKILTFSGGHFCDKVLLR